MRLRFLTITLIFATLCASSILADSNIVWPIEVLTTRTDLSPEDQNRVRDITTPTTLFNQAEPFENNSGGGATNTRAISRHSFSRFSSNLDLPAREQFLLGKALFRKLWVSSPASTQASDGLGPLFNARSCETCHQRNGRGHPPFTPEDSAVSMFLRLSVPPKTPEQHDAIASLQALLIGDPVYGTQLQNKAVPGFSGEGQMVIAYEEQPVELADGTIVSLRAPTYSIQNPQYGPLSNDLMISPRVTPQMIGLGLLEAIHEADIVAKADPDDMDGDGISGRPNFVYDPALKAIALGRFGWKLGQASVRSQSSAAFNGDIGISTPLHNFPSGDCTSLQPACMNAPTGEQDFLGKSETPDPILDLVTFYSKNLAVPARRNSDDRQVLLGKSIFYQSGCISCHTPKYVTSRKADDEHAFQLIWPYTDLLLHDMGDGLADNRPEGLANGQEWRTAPLWGIGLTATVNEHTLFLHDGRARNLLEAILWHGGEAQAARDIVVNLNEPDRNSLIAFLESL